MLLSQVHKLDFLDRYISETLSAGNIVSSLDIQGLDTNFSIPRFSSLDSNILPDSISSATFCNSLMNIAIEDLGVIYKYLDSKFIEIEQSASNSILKIRKLGKRITQDNERVRNLLLLQQYTDGYFNYISETFSNNSRVDSSSTTILSNSVVTVGPASMGLTLIDTSTASISFTVLSKNSLISSSDMAGSSLTNCLKNDSSFWQAKIVSSSDSSVTAEVIINLQSSVDISRIDISPHSAGNMTIMYSTDNYTWTNISTATAEVRIDVSIIARYIKIVFQKTSYDYMEGDYFVYLIGLNRISIYESEVTEDESTFLSTALSITGTTIGSASLDVCESLPTGTTIDFYLSASNTTTPGTFIPVDPLSRSVKNYSSVVDFSKSTEVTVSGVVLSYQKGVESKFTSPARNYTIINNSTAGVVDTSSCVSSDRRYILPDNSHYLLNHVIASGVNISDGTLEVWRNTPTGNKVRGVQSGWSYSSPYYQTTLLVEESEGKEINFGTGIVEIDNISSTGKVKITQGYHIIRIHENNWREITTGLTSLSSLKSADSLYPFNHRYLIEGYVYPTTWVDEKIYTGFTIGEYRLFRTGTLGSLSEYILDVDLPDSAAVIDGSVTSRPAQTCIVVKADSSWADFLNERFTLRWITPEERFANVFLKAILKSSEGLVPSIGSYKIRIGG